MLDPADFYDWMISHDYEPTALETYTDDDRRLAFRNRTLDRDEWLRICHEYQEEDHDV